MEAAELTPARLDVTQQAAPPALPDRAALVERAQLFNIESRGRAHGGFGDERTERLLDLMADFALALLRERGAEVERMRAERRADTLR